MQSMRNEVFLLYAVNINGFAYKLDLSSVLISIKKFQIDH